MKGCAGHVEAFIGCKDCGDIVATVLRDTLIGRLRVVEGERDAAIKEAERLRVEAAEALRAVVEYARHAEGCSAPFGPYGCKCGFADVLALPAVRRVMEECDG